MDRHNPADRTMVRRGTPRALFGNIGLRGPFLIGEFVAHDSRLRLGSLNRVQAAIIAKGPIDSTAAFRAWPDLVAPVAIDPLVISPVDDALRKVIRLLGRVTLRAQEVNLGMDASIKRTEGLPMTSKSGETAKTCDCFDADHDDPIQRSWEFTAPKRAGPLLHLVLPARRQRAPRREESSDRSLVVGMRHPQRLA